VANSSPRVHSHGRAKLPVCGANRWTLEGALGRGPNYVTFRAVHAGARYGSG
jgi:hypothetical protein